MAENQRKFTRNRIRLRLRLRLFIYKPHSEKGK